jgi:hypothetical protein
MTYTEITDENFNDISTSGRYYSMFSIEGNEAVAKIVDKAKACNTSWKLVLTQLKNLSLNKHTEEATDTAVREHVYCVLYPEKVRKEYEE